MFANYLKIAARNCWCVSMKQPAIVILLFGVLAGRCDKPFDQKFSQIVIGESRLSVEQALGKPHKTTLGVVPAGPYFGPQEELLEILGPNAEYEEWLYQLNGNDYYVWFGDRDNIAKEKWKVVSSGSYPRGAVF